MSALNVTESRPVNGQGEKQMTTGIEFLKQPQPKKGRGLGKKPALFNTSIRLPAETLDYFRDQHPYNMQAKMREILVDYVRAQLKAREE